MAAHRVSNLALFEVGELLRRALHGSIEPIGLPEAKFAVKGSESFSRLLAVPNRTGAVNVLMDWLEEHSGRDAFDRGGASRGAWRPEV
jgi:hypothetical protein